ncbi:MAG TPA: prephenate dehydrogenase/arogenate dehydrogenase family protein [Gammaproteobacteria bacterium]|nr:prephenate dehydrogenase/arogenate dehydrogenase family protein [Gammaproteobacteria bacterium]|tara:strand:- start:350 stop:1219 length:870 start_codon:yes stop_codon:yes gene_type:complete
MIHRLCIFGVGLIGGSLAKALRAASAVDRIVGCGRTEANLVRAVELNVIDEYTLDPVTAVTGADMIVVAVTLGATRSIFEQITEHIAPTTILTDVGSAKARVVDAARECLGESFSRFVPGHPIAGTEKSGVDAAFETLFCDHRVILTPLVETNRDALKVVFEMWQATGADVVEMAVQRHDEVLAATSHLPHMLAYALVDCLAESDESNEIFTYAAGGFRDFTRIASSDPAMWCDIAIENRDALLSALNSFTVTYGKLFDALESNDKDQLLRIFTRAKNAREGAMIKITE